MSLAKNNTESLIMKQQEETQKHVMLYLPNTGKIKANKSELWQVNACTVPLSSPAHSFEN